MAFTGCLVHTLSCIKILISKFRMSWNRAMIFWNILFFCLKFTFFSSCCWCLYLTRWMAGWSNNVIYCHIVPLCMEPVYTSNISHLTSVEQTQIYHPKQYKKQNNSFTFQQFAANNIIHYNWHKRVKQCVEYKWLSFWCFLLFGSCGTSELICFLLLLQT